MNRLSIALGCWIMSVDVTDGSLKRVRRAVAYLIVRGKSFTVCPVHYDKENRKLVFEHDVEIWGYRFQLERLLEGSARSVALFKSEPFVRSSPMEDASV